MTGADLIRAAGCVVWRRSDDALEVLVVRRRRHDDCSFPKGKLDPGETAVVAAVREVREETGLVVRLGAPLPEVRYQVDGRPKVVQYWTARTDGDGDVSAYRPNDEIDAVEWLPVRSAFRSLSYDHDRDLLFRFERAAYRASPLLVVRHAAALRRKDWEGPDSRRPLRQEGVRQAQALVPLLAAYGVRHVVSSDAARCVDTVRPYVDTSSAELRLDGSLSQDGYTPDALRARVGTALRSDQRVALCSHRPVLPHVFTALGLDPVELALADTFVAHRLAGTTLAAERHPGFA